VRRSRNPTQKFPLEVKSWPGISAARSRSYPGGSGEEIKKPYLMLLVRSQEMDQKLKCKVKILSWRFR
jgi:hypothetical protein